MGDPTSQDRMVVSRGLNLYCALLRIRLQMFLFLYTNALCTKACAIYGEFCGSISLLTYNAVSNTLGREAPEMQMQTLASVTREFCFTKSELDQLIFKTLPRMYLMGKSALELRVAIVSVRQVIPILTGKRPPRASTPGQHTKSKNLRILLHGIECTPILQQTLAASFQSLSLYSCRYFTSTSSSTSFHPTPFSTPPC